MEEEEEAEVTASVIHDLCELLHNSDCFSVGEEES